MFNRKWEPLEPQPLQRQMTQTPTGGADPDDTGRLGFYVVHADHDYGYCEGLQVAFNKTEQKLESRRTAVRTPVKNRVTSQEVRVSFLTRSIKNTNNIALWNLSAKGGVRPGAMVITMPGDEGEEGLQLTLPNVDLAVSSGFDGEFAENFMGFPLEGLATGITPETADLLELIAAATAP